MPRPLMTQAVVFEAPLTVVVRDIEIPPPGPDDLVIDTIATWISPGTEMSYLKGERIYGDTAAVEGSPHPFPRVAGYQKIGRIVDVGKNVRGFKVGQVVFNTFGRARGMFEAQAGHIKTAVSAPDDVYALPQGVDPQWFSGGVLTQVGYNCASRVPVETGDLAVVLGDGLVGLWTAQMLQHRGAKVWLVGRHEMRLSRFNCREGDRAIRLARGAKLEPLTAQLDEPIAVLVETVGTLAPMIELIPHMRHNGQLVCAAFYGGPTRDVIHVPQIRSRELSLHTPAGLRRARMAKTFELIAQGILQTAPLITHRLPYANAAHAFDLLMNHKDQALGVLLLW